MALWRYFYDQTFYSSSATLAASGDSGIIASPFTGTSGGVANYPNVLVAVGKNIATDETCVVTLDWYMDAAGLHPCGDQMVFASLTASVLNSILYWTGTVYALPPWFKASWTIGGAAPSLGFDIFMSYTRLEP